MGPNLTFDTGALIALEGGRANLLKVVAAAAEYDKLIFVPHLASLGEDTERKGSKLTVDALVMASAASRGDVLYTSDPFDLERLLEFFKAVKRIEKV